MSFGGVGITKEYEASTIRKKVGPTMCLFLRRNFCSQFRCTTLCRNSIESFKPTEENNAVTIPSAAAVFTYIAQHLRATTGCLNL
jgi:hypothetical protein